MKHVNLIFLTILCLMASGCRKELYYIETSETVDVQVTWPDSISVPEGIRAIFYPSDGSLPFVFNFKSTGGTAYVPSGDYSVLFFNNDTEYLWYQNALAYSSIEVYTSILLKAGKTKGFPQQNVVNMPDLFYTYRLPHYRVSKDSLSMVPLMVEPEGKVVSMEVHVKIIGLKNVSSAIGYLSGVAGSYFVGLDSVPSTSSAIAFDFGQKNDQYIYAMARTFGLSGVEPKENIFRLILTLINGETKTCDFDVTDFMEIDLRDQIILNVPDSVVVEDVSGDPGSGSGFSATVEGWEDIGVDIEL